MQENECTHEAKLTIEEATKWLASHEDDVLEQYSEFLREHGYDVLMGHPHEVLFQRRCESVFISFHRLYAKIFIKLLLGGLTIANITPTTMHRLHIRWSHN
jgi:hypothetical protein